MLILWLILLGSPALASEDICVLVHERQSHSFAKSIAGIFKGQPRAKVILEATPLDFYDCATGDYTEIIMLAHTLYRKGDPSYTQLAYFSAPDASGKYGPPRPFLNHIFEKTRTALREKELGGEIPLKNIRLLSCDPSLVFKNYPAFKGLVKEFDLSVESAPRQILMSWIEQRRVSTLDRRWIESSNFFSDDDRWFFAYLNLKTYGVYRHGSGLALRGQYRIRYKGFALGFGSKWSTVYVRFKDVRNLDVGEKKTIIAPQLDIAAALWLNIELGLGRHPYVQTPTEINSLGASIGFFSAVEIERLY